MTNLELVYHNLTPCGMGRPKIESVVAMSCSHSALERFAKENYKEQIGEGGVFENYLTIQPSSVVIVPERKN